MQQAGMFIPFASIKEFAPDVRAALADYIAESMGTAAYSPAAGDEEGATELSLAQAKEFLNTLSDKTLNALEAMIARKGRFSMSDVQAELGVPKLGPVLTGLTRRVRKVTGDAEALLFNWWKIADKHDWQGVMSSRTVQSFEIALSERKHGAN